ncbi:hypothetical protein Hanom_Chr15g01387501 [Helianthus anomalus]
MYTFSTLLLPSRRKFAGIVNQKIFPVTFLPFVCKKKKKKWDRGKGRQGSGKVLE